MEWYHVLASILYPARAALGVFAAGLFLMEWRHTRRRGHLLTAIMLAFDAVAFALLAIATGVHPVLALEDVVPVVRVAFGLAFLAEAFMVWRFLRVRVRYAVRSQERRQQRDKTEPLTV